MQLEEEVVMMVVDLEQGVVLVELVFFQYQTQKHEDNHLILE